MDHNAREERNNSVEGGGLLRREEAPVLELLLLSLQEERLSYPWSIPCKNIWYESWSYIS